MNELGIFKGENCKRNGCLGIIDENDTDGCCSCHINPPCSYCTTSREYCPECGWDGREEQIEAEKPNAESYKGFGSKQMHDDYHEEKAKRDAFYKKFEAMYRGLEPVDKVTIIREIHTHFSMIIRGVFPNNSETRESLKEKHSVNGTFGGRFERFDDHSFKFIAYTD